MQVVILGSGSPIPAPDRAGPSTLVRTSVGDLLFDAGRGVLLRATGAQSGAVGLPGGLPHPSAQRPHHRPQRPHHHPMGDVVHPDPTRVVGPVGTAALVAATEAMLELDIGYRLAHHDDLDWRPGTLVTEVTERRRLRGGRRAGDAPHRPTTPRCTRPSATGWTTATGRWSSPGTPSPATGSTTLAAGADVLVHTVVRRDQIEALGLPRLHRRPRLPLGRRPTPPAPPSGRGSGRLVLTHMVPPVQPGAGQEWIDQARAAFGGDDRPGRGPHHHRGRTRRSVGCTLMERR